MSSVDRVRTIARRSIKVYDYIMNELLDFDQDHQTITVKFSNKNAETLKQIYSALPAVKPEDVIIDTPPSENHIRMLKLTKFKEKTVHRMTELILREYRKVRAAALRYVGTSTFKNYALRIYRTQVKDKLVDTVYTIEIILKYDYGKLVKAIEGEYFPYNLSILNIIEDRALLGTAHTVIMRDGRILSNLGAVMKKALEKDPDTELEKILEGVEAYNPLKIEKSSRTLDKPFSDIEDIIREMGLDNYDAIMASWETLYLFYKDKTIIMYVNRSRTLVTAQFENDILGVPPLPNFAIPITVRKIMTLLFDYNTYTISEREIIMERQPENMLATEGVVETAIGDFTVTPVDSHPPAVGKDLVLVKSMTPNVKFYTLL
ncbi:hypothetical protein [Pyrococcus kukulkanii]|uniref:Flagellar motor switch protein FliM n=1 Tax=Pyrococcus kukulkanii TaxID=1609559 RepID=A0ABV4T5U9_9EURY